MLSFYTFVHATESISTIGIIAFSVIFTIMWSYLSKEVYDKVPTINNCCVKSLRLIFFLSGVLAHFSINTITYFTIVVYITFLNSLPKSPEHFLLELVCAFIPPLLAAGFTFGLQWWAPQNKIAMETPDPVGQRRDGYEPV